jgi:hypothetical protein
MVIESFGATSKKIDHRTIYFLSDFTLYKGTIQVEEGLKTSEYISQLIKNDVDTMSCFSLYNTKNGKLVNYKEFPLSNINSISDLDKSFPYDKFNEEQSYYKFLTNNFNGNNITVSNLNKTFNYARGVDNFDYETTYVPINENKSPAVGLESKLTKK